MSADLVWAIIKNNNSFLVKRQHVQFSSEPANLKNINSFKYSGLANYKTVSILPAARGVRVTTRKANKQNSPAKSINSVVIAKTRRQTSKSVANLIAKSKYRPDLRAVSIDIKKGGEERNGNKLFCMSYLHTLFCIGCCRSCLCSPFYSKGSQGPRQA
ncbi:unnamed protein product [Mucor circinelloides]